MIHLCGHKERKLTGAERKQVVTAGITAVNNGTNLILHRIDVPPQIKNLVQRMIFEENIKRGYKVGNRLLQHPILFKIYTCAGV